MIHFVIVSKKHQKLVEKWFLGDEAEQQELSFYKDFDKWLNTTYEKPRYRWIAYKEKNSENIPIGFVDLEKDSQDSASFSFYIAPKERNKGQGKELLSALITKARKLGVNKLIAGAEENNIASQKALESIGFMTSGRDKDNYIIQTYKIE